LSPLLLLIASLLAGAWGSLVLHEGAHALVGRLVGLQIREIRFGIGPTVFRCRLRETEIRVGLLPSGGWVMTFPPLSHGKPALALFYLAGPIADLAWLVGLLAVFRAYGGTPAVNIAMLSVILLHIVRLWGSLVPHWGTLYGTRLPNDMLALWRTLRRKDDQAYRAAYLDALRRYRDPAEPAPPLSGRSDRIAYHILQARAALRPLTDEAIDALGRELSRASERSEQLLIIESMVMSVLARPGSRHRVHLDPWTSRALALSPDLPTVRGSRGAALVRLGRHREALDILARAESADDADRCLTGAFQALAHFHEGRRDLSADLIEASLTILRTHGWEGWIGRGIVERIRAEIEPRAGGNPQRRPEDEIPTQA